MRSGQPEGPYYFGGMCMGAHIAFEMARHLEAQGQKIGLLAIFDTWVLENTHNRLWHVHYYTKRLRLFWRKDWSKRRDELRRFWHNRTSKLRSRLKGEPLPVEPWREIYWPGADYVSPKIRSAVTLLAVEKQPFYRVNDETLGWRTRTAGGVDLHVVPGDHNSLHREPNIGKLADMLKTSLEKAYAANQQVLAADAEQDEPTMDHVALTS